MLADAALAECQGAEHSEAGPRAVSFPSVPAHGPPPATLTSAGPRAPLTWGQGGRGVPTPL